MTWMSNFTLLLITNSISILFVWLLFQPILIPLISNVNTASIAGDMARRLRFDDFSF